MNRTPNNRAAWLETVALIAILAIFATFAPLVGNPIGYLL